MAGKGGYQKPNNPSTTPSLPGSLSQRTDGGPASKQTAQYISGMPNWGDGQDLMDISTSAPLAATPNAKPMPAAQVRDAAMQGMAQPTGLLAPTQQPSVAVTDGAALGAGRGVEALNLQSQDLSQYQTAKDQIQTLAASPMASPALKYLAQRINQAY
jgi:hypothetical protein